MPPYPAMCIGRLTHCLSKMMYGQIVLDSPILYNFFPDIMTNFYNSQQIPISTIVLLHVCHHIEKYTFRTYYKLRTKLRCSTLTPAISNCAHLVKLYNRKCLTCLNSSMLLLSNLLYVVAQN